MRQAFCFQSLQSVAHGSASAIAAMPWRTELTQRGTDEVRCNVLVGLRTGGEGDPASSKRAIVAQTSPLIRDDESLHGGRGHAVLVATHILVADHADAHRASRAILPCLVTAAAVTVRIRLHHTKLVARQASTIPTV